MLGESFAATFRNGEMSGYIQCTPGGEGDIHNTTAMP